MSKSFDIGDMFLSWKVIERVEPMNKYRYKCSCAGCGEEKIFSKYNLLLGKYAPCRTCARGYIKLTNNMKENWNSELNGFPIDRLEFLSPSKSYWFLCSNGHNYKSSIKAFNSSKCSSCSNGSSSSNNMNSVAYELLFETMLHLYAASTIKKYKDNVIIVESLGTALILNESDRFTSYRNYYSCEKEYLVAVEEYKALEMELRNQGYKIVPVGTKKTLAENVDNTKEIVLQLLQ